MPPRKNMTVTDTRTEGDKCFILYRHPVLYWGKEIGYEIWHGEITHCSGCRNGAGNCPVSKQAEKLLTIMNGE